MKTKKIITIILTLLLILQCSIAAFASQTVTVSADKVSLSQNKQTLIPIKIENNSGIMGFKITVEYPVDKLDIKSVSRGEITSKGNFNTNFGVNDGRFDVLWNNVDEIKSDGTLFLISAQAKVEISEDTQIKISFSQPDTFNEKYEDVIFDCRNIVISSEYIDATSQETMQNDAENTSKLPIYINNSQILDAVKITLEQNGYESLNAVKDTDGFIKDFNKNLETITGTNEHNVSDFDTIISMYNSAYEGEFITEVTNNIDAEQINLDIKEALNEVKVKAINEIDDKDKEKFVKKVEERLKAHNPDTKNISGDLETDKAVKIIEKLYNSTYTENDGQNNSKSNNSKVNISIAVIVIILGVLIISITVVLKKKKKLNNDESE